MASFKRGCREVRVGIVYRAGGRGETLNAQGRGPRTEGSCDKISA